MPPYFKELMQNRKGEIATAIVVAIAAGSLLFGLIAPKVLSFGGLFHRNAAHKKASFTHQIEKSKPVLLSDKSGKPVAIANEVELRYETGEEDGTPKQTLGERIGGFISGLTTNVLIFLIVSIVFFGGAPIVLAFRAMLRFKSALKNTVVAIRGIDEETYVNKVKPALAASHDKRDKIVIDEIKKELH